MPWKNLPRQLQLYIFFLIVAGMAAFVQPLLSFEIQPIEWALAAYVALALITARVNVRIPYTDVHFSMDTAFIYAILMIYGTLPAMAADAASKIINTLPHIKKESWYKAPFNVASGAISVFAAGKAYYLLLPGNPQLVHYVLPLCAMAMAYFLLNSWTVAVAISLQTRMHLWKLWVENFLWTGIGFFAALSVAIMLYMLHFTVGVLGFVVSVPIIGLVYFSQRVNLKREEENTTHIQELETMHMDTIETLSLAIDAKDQVTHGHVHRVQAYVTKLAEILGITDEKELKGLRFAALVHDIGKIAIPDLILNKPGRFTTDEMERMKVHPVVGAQILKAVSRDFPIADIVLAHHERWDGRGYPHGVKAEKISKFSRMLAVCDVYDALRSDRPYRGAMCREKALQIIRDERGKGFDPEIADAFVKHVETMEAAAAEEDRRIEELTYSTPSSTDPYALSPDKSAMQLYGQISYTQQEMLLMYEVAQMVSKSLTVDEIAASLVRGVGRLIPYNAAIVYLANQQERRLQAHYIDARMPEGLRGLELEFGSGISGWVAQNAHPMRNVNAQLDLAGRDTGDGEYRSALSVPVLFDKQTVGVITLYSEKDNFYQEAHQDLLAKLANMVTPALVNSLKYSHTFVDSLIDSLTGLGNLRAMRRYFAETLVAADRKDVYTLCLLDLQELRRVNDKHGHEIGDRVLTETARTIESVLRPEDRCFRYGGDEFVIIANGAGDKAARVLAERLRTAIQRLVVKVARVIVQPEVSLGFASYPADGQTPEELLRVADGAMYKDRLRNDRGMVTPINRAENA